VSIFIGSDAGETIEPGTVSSTVAVIGNPKTPSAGFDLIFARGGNDRVAGGGGNDIAFLGAGDDLFTWNSGDGSDFVDGGSGIDTLAFNGSAAAETIRISTGVFGTLRVSNSAENVTMTLTGMERIVVSAGAGDDVVDASALPAGRAALEIFGGLGRDTLIGSAGNDFFNGGDGNDLALMGAGDDSFVWNPGDDNDTLEGQAGVDTLLFNGAIIGEQINVLANGGRVLFTRDIANVVMDLNDVERIDFNALGGADIVAVHDLSGTDVAEVNVNVGSADAAADQVIVRGTSGNDVIRAAASGSSASVTGLAAVTNVTNLESIDQLIVDGQGGNDTLIGGAGSQVLRGGDGDDVISGGDGDDQMFGDAGNDRMVWNPGDDTDLVEGGDGQDTAEVNGGNGAEIFTATANGTRVRFDRLDPAPFALDIGTTENLVVNMNGGNDSFSATGNLAALIKITVDGGAGDDTILGANGADLLLGGDGDDFIDGQQGADVAFLGSGEDTFQWDPGDGSDVVEGQDGIDTMLFNGSTGAEIFTASANGGRMLFMRNLGNIVMDLNDVESIDLNALGNTDQVIVNDLSGTDVVEANVNLAGTLGGADGDGAADQVIVNGTNGDDTIQAVASGTSVSVLGLAAQTNVSNLESIDQLIVDGQGGNDTLIGGAGSQVLRGGDGDDVIAGGDGDDQMFGDAGNDRMVWNPGDDTDLMEGGADIDTAEANGGGGAEAFTATANGTRVRFDRLDPAPFALDIGTTENLVVNMNGGNDSFSATGNLAALIKITVDGGAGDDTILGANGADLLLGGDGNDFIDGQQGADVAFLGAGDDTFQWDPGDGSDVVEGQDGIDTMLFNGSAGAEIFEASANGGRMLFTRNLGNIVMDLDDVERIDLNALSNTDTVIVNDLSGTDVVEVNVNLGGDGAADQVVVNGAAGDDVAVIVGDASGVSVLGLAAQVNITHAEGALDELRVNGGAGDDVFAASSLAAGAIRLVLDGGDGDDVIVGSEGDDVLLGGEGDDVIVGGGGNDLIDAGPGDNVVIQDFTSGEDRIDLRGITGADDFAWLLAHAKDVGGSTVIDFGDGDEMTLTNVTVASLQADDFLLA
jgi:Ca2+-binding RTX toxin-like protein